MPRVAKRRRRSGPDSTRVGLIEAGLQAFALHGFEGASTRDIAAAAQVPQGLVRHHFGSKEGLWRAIVAEGAARLARELGEARGPEPLTVAAWVESLPTHAELLRMLGHALMAPGPMRDFALTELTPVWERLRELQQRACGPSSTDARLAMWLAASLALPVFGAALEPALAGSAIAQRNTLFAWLTATETAAHSGPFSLAAARIRLRG